MDSRRAKLDYSTVTTSKPLHVPDEDELVKVLTDGLKGNFGNVSVSFEACPDLTKEPYFLASKGLCGHPRLVDVGGVPNLVPVVKRNKIYNLKDVAKAIGLPGAFFIGAGAGSSRLVGVNCELMPNSHIATSEINTHFAKVDPKTDKIILEHYASNEFGLLANFLATDGSMDGNVLKIEVDTRIGEENFVSCIRNTLHAFYGKDKPVGLGGVFVIETGDAKIHVMPNFSDAPLDTDDDVEEWLNFYTCHSPLTCLSVLISSDPGLDLRVEHTHCFSAHGEGGHYHCDTTPKEVKYCAYFQVAPEIFRVDPPTETHQVGQSKNAQQSATER
eukprot:m.26004 g.26004  ORF g.26004 m.26004 type:complete len:330 (-) comp5817_c0_seq3:339-1328(-)